MSLNVSPQHLDKIQLAMKFWQEEQRVTQPFYRFFQPAFIHSQKEYAVHSTMDYHREAYSLCTACSPVLDHPATNLIQLGLS